MESHCRGAHHKCNLQCLSPEFEHLVVIHLPGYNVHFVMKQLGISGKRYNSSHSLREPYFL